MDVLRRLEGRVALITGGGAGIGRAAGVRMAAEGASVAVADIRPERAEEVRREMEALGAKALAVEADVTKAADCERMVREAVRELGRLDVLVTCAGVGAGGDVVETTEEYWDRIVGLDLKGVFLASKFAVPEMRKAGGGSIVHVSSIGGLRGGFAASFAAAKGGVVNLTRSMAVTHAEENIRVNCVCPGVILTPLTEKWLSAPGKLEDAKRWHPMGRIGRPEEVASAIAFLASEEASFITGAILPIDGGYAAAGRDSLSR